MHRMRILAIAATALLLAGCSAGTHTPARPSASQTRPAAFNTAPATDYGDNASVLLSKVAGCAQPKDTTTAAVMALGITSTASCPIAAGGTIDMVTYTTPAVQDSQDNSALAATTDETYYATGTGWSAMADDTDVFTEQSVAKALVRALGGRVAHQAARPS